MNYFTIAYISIFSPLLPLTVGFRKRNTLLWFYALAGFSFDIISLIIRTGNSYSNNNPGLLLAENIFLIFEFALVSLYYRGKVFRNSKYFFWIMAMIISIYILTNATKRNMIFNFVGGSIFDFSCIILAVIGFYSLIKKKEVIFLDKSPFFWVNVAFLIYCTGNFLTFLFAEYLKEKDGHFLVNLWIFHNVLNILFSILIAISFLKRNIEE
jgi:hypothetical protein